MTLSAAALVLALLIVLLVINSGKVKKINLTNDDLKYHDIVGNYKTVYFDENGRASYKIEYEVTPASLSDKVKFEYTKKQGITVDDTGLVTFEAPEGVTEMSVKVKIVPKNGYGDTETAVTINAKRPLEK